MGQKLNINWFYTVFCFNFDISKINVQTIILIIFSIAYAFWKGGLIPDSDLFLQNGFICKKCRSYGIILLTLTFPKVAKYDH